MHHTDWMSHSDPLVSERIFFRRLVFCIIAGISKDLSAIICSYSSLTWFANSFGCSSLFRSLKTGALNCLSSFIFWKNGDAEFAIYYKSI